MAGQNILNFYGLKLDIKVDNSELYDFELDNTPEIDGYNFGFNKKPLFEITIYGCGHELKTQDEFSLLTQNGECLQFQF